MKASKYDSTKDFKKQIKIIEEESLKHLVTLTLKKD